MQRSNLYIIIFSVILTVILGGLLSGTSVVLKPLQDEQVELDTKKKILGTVMNISDMRDSKAILQVYNKRVKSEVVNSQGEVMPQDAKGAALIAEKIDFQKNHNKFKKDPQDRPYPVFMFMKPDGSGVDAYIFPMFGNGLWDWISGFVALDADLNTVRGVSFDHKAETPGLGARITTESVRDRYRGKQIFDTQGGLQSVSMVKGEKGLPLDTHHVDGLSGATLTGKGVNAMMYQYLGFYVPFIKRIRAEEPPPTAKASPPATATEVESMNL